VDTANPHQRCARVAARQHAAISHAQALQAGLTQRQVDLLVERRQWKRPAMGVYVVAGSPPSWRQDVAVACLASAGAVASHRSAAALYGWCDPPEISEVTGRAGTSGRQAGRVHHAPIASEDRCVVDGTPATTPARTVIDCAAVLSVEDLCDLVDKAFYRRKRLARQVQLVLRRLGTRGRRGMRALEEAMWPWVSGVRPGSPAEARCLRAFARWGLPAPERQYEVKAEKGKVVGRVDFAWPADMLLFEYDGEEYHGPRQWQADAEREAAIDRLGWTVERGDKEDFRPSATALRDRLRKLLL
jgi:hypothetical protein